MSESIFTNKMKRLFYYIYIIGVCATLLLASCANRTAETNGERIHTQYASLLHMEQNDSFTVVNVVNPWNTHHQLAQYVLVPRSQPLPHQLPQGTLVRTPLQRAAITSSVHAALLLELHASDAIAAMTDTSYIVADTLKAYLRQHAHRIRSAGQSMSPDIEQLRAAQTDAILVSPFENAGHGSLDRLDIPLIECADYMETSPLARAEWMKFYGMLFGQTERADSLFAEVEKAYNAIKAQAAKHAPKPTVMCDMRMGNVWYQPGGNSTMGRLITDAGGQYLWADRQESGSLSLDFESVFARAKQADVWLIKYGQPTDLTYAQMAADFQPYTQFAAWKNRHIYACNTLRVPYFEETPFHPECVLRNLYEIFCGTRSTPSEKSSTYYTPLR